MSGLDGLGWPANEDREPSTVEGQPQYIDQLLDEEIEDNLKARA